MHSAMTILLPKIKHDGHCLTPPLLLFIWKDVLGLFFQLLLHKLQQVFKADSLLHLRPSLIKYFVQEQTTGICT